MKTDPNNPVRATAARDLALAAGLVLVDEARIKQIERPSDLQSMGSVLPGSPLLASPQAYIPFFIAMNTMNYQFWDVTESGGFVRYSRDGVTGAHAMQQSFHDAWVDILNGLDEELLPAEAAASTARALKAHLSANGLQSLFGGIPDPGGPGVASRLEILDEVLDPARLSMAASFLCDRAGIDQELNWCDALVLANLFPKSYGDDYLKKAQLTLMFIASEWNAQCANFGVRPITLSVTAAADYQLPKVLRSLGVLVYSPELSATVDNGVLIEADSLEEIGIRAATIYACDKLAEQFDCTIEEVDFWLWANRNAARDAKFHLTKTTSY